VLDSPPDEGPFNELMGYLHWEGMFPNAGSSEDEQQQKIEILRSKGYFRTADGRRWGLQGVRNLFEVKEILRIGETEDQDIEGKLVLIGKGMSDLFEAQLASQIDKLKGRE
jgi:G3E family GTPase